MLKINNKEYKVLSSEIKYVNATYNDLKGYSILVNIDIEYNTKKGYVSFYVDFFDNNLMQNMEGKVYKEIATDLYAKINLIEIFDGNEFFDFIESVVILKFGKIVGNTIEMEFNFDDKLINLGYKGILDIK